MADADCATCPRCGALRGADETPGLCPRCRATDHSRDRIEIPPVTPSSPAQLRRKPAYRFGGGGQCRLSRLWGLVCQSARPARGRAQPSLSARRRSGRPGKDG